MAYYMLFVRDDSRWAPQFGDQDKHAVAFEYADYIEHGHRDRDLKVVSYPKTPTESEIQKTAANLNRGPV